jgi:hypothetical protein
MNLALNMQTFGRLAAILIAAALLYGLTYRFEAAFYVAFPIALVAYTLVRAAFAYFAPSPAGPGRK